MLLTWKDSAVPYLARILGSLMVARLVPLTIKGVPPLGMKNKIKKHSNIKITQL